MSPVRVSVMLSLVAVATSAFDLEMVGGRCDEFVEQPAKCSEAPGCKVVNEWDCVEDVPAADPTGKVWLQFPDRAGVPTPDELIPGVLVTGDPMSVWNDVDVGFAQFPEFLKGTKLHGVEHIYRRGGLRFECPANHDHVPCDFFVTVFACPGRCGEQVDGGLPQLLTVTNGWEPRSCAPMMSVLSSDFKMKIFRVRVPAGLSMETPRLPRTAHYIGVFSSVGERMYCPAAVKSSGPFPPGKTCGDKCPFDFDS